ncbi:MAG TPA: hypothetical protein VKR60_14335 [Candidatus Sulfotelmatobacter sp.]|nr:hypothetical protein [Candidatus Sulfotelmatobacter sp.]
MSKRSLPCMFASAFLVLAASSCEQPKAAAPPPSISPSEHVAPSPVGTDLNVLQKSFALKTSVAFPFEIPAHAVRPHLHGLFASFVGDVHGDSGSAANLDFLVLNQSQYGDFQNGRPSEALFSVEGSHNQAVNFDLPASMDQPVKYYLVFRSSGGEGKKVVEATFKVDF